MIAFRKKFLIKTYYKHWIIYFDRGFEIAKLCYNTKLPGVIVSKIKNYIRTFLNVDIKVNLKEKEMVKATIERIQGDIFPTEIKVYKDDKEADLSGYNAKIQVRKGNDILEAEGTIEGNVVYVTPTAEMVADVGLYPFQVKVYNDNESMTILTGNLSVIEGI